MKNLIRLLSLSGLIVAVALSAVATASAHADLESSDPAADAVLAAAPAKVTLTFIEEIQHTAGSYSLGVTNASGQSVTAGAPTIGADSMSLSVALSPSLPNGTYTVVWSNLSTDGDALTDEQFSFTVGAATLAPAAPPPHEDAAHGHADDDASDPSQPFDPATLGFIAIAMAPQHDSAVSGRAEIFPAEGGAHTRIDVHLSNMKAGTSHMTHVHSNLSCDEVPGSHAADLNNVVADDQGRGLSSTTVDVPFSSIADGRHIILSHAGANAEGDKTTIACGDIPAQPAAAHPTSLPHTGAAPHGSNNAETIALLAAIVLAGTLITASGITAVRRGR